MNRLQQFRAGEAVDAGFFGAGGDALLEDGHAHLEKLVDVGSENGQENDAAPAAGLAGSCASISTRF